MLKRIITIIVVIAFFALGILLTHVWYTSGQVHTTAEADILEKRIETVAKLVTVEGHFTELYTYQDYWKYDWWIFRKKAILRVKAKVSVGYDLGNLEVDARPDENLVIIKNIPTEPEILAIDPKMDYYDLAEGTFNSFSEKDLTRIQKDARNFIEVNALESELMQTAKEQGIQVLDIMKTLAENAGWEVRFYNQKNSLLEFKEPNPLKN